MLTGQIYTDFSEASGTYLFDIKKRNIEKIVDIKPDLIGFSVYTKDYQWSIMMARLIKKELDIPIIFGGQYYLAITPFVILFLAMLVFLISLPVHNSIIYYFGKPNVFVWVSMGHLLIIGILGYFLISAFGIIGASVTVLTGMIFNLLAPLGWLLIKIKR